MLLRWQSQGEPDSLDAHQIASETILVVEDDNAVHNLAVRILRDTGYGLIEASGGVEALDS